LCQWEFSNDKEEGDQNLILAALSENPHRLIQLLQPNSAMTADRFVFLLELLCNLL
jgi:hypothetical protein